MTGTRLLDRFVRRGLRDASTYHPEALVGPAQPTPSMGRTDQPLPATGKGICAHALCGDPVVSLDYGCRSHQAALPAEVRRGIADARSQHGGGSWQHLRAMHAADVAWLDQWREAHQDTGSGDAGQP